MVKHIRSKHRDDWDRAVNGREDSFRSDVAALFGAPRYRVLPTGALLRRNDGTPLTDIDAVVLDNDSGTVALVQLKWHDIYGRSLRERESRKRNLLGANQWVERVSRWVGTRSSADVVDAFGVLPTGARQTELPVIIVVARYAARFSGQGECDARAAWLTWPELVRAATSQCAHPDSLRAIATTFKGKASVAWRAGGTTVPTLAHFRLHGFEIEVTGDPAKRE
jgi:hypothetical protein